MTSLDDLLCFLLREHVPAIAADDLPGWWRGTGEIRSRFPLPIERAVASGRSADRLGFAFAGGYEAAIHALVPSLPSEAIAGLSVTEEGGNHPRAIRTRLERASSGYVLTGDKRWSTMGPLADTLVIVAKEGIDEAGRPRLRAVCVDKGTAGLTVKQMPPPPFVPEVPHAELVLDRVSVADAAVLPGDGYADYTKPFRTVEDLHVNASLLGYLLSAAARHGWPASVVERLIALVAAVHALSPLDPRRAETHLSLAGLLGQIRAAVTDLEPHWALASDAERERWYRDRALTHVAERARAERRERALETLLGDGKR